MLCIELYILLFYCIWMVLTNFLPNISSEIWLDKSILYILKKIPWKYCGNTMVNDDNTMLKKYQATMIHAQKSCLNHVQTIMNCEKPH